MTTSITCPNASVDLIARPLLVCLIGVESIQYSTVQYSTLLTPDLVPALPRSVLPLDDVVGLTNI